MFKEILIKCTNPLLNINLTFEQDENAFFKFFSLTLENMIFVTYFMNYCINRFVIIKLI